MTVLPLDQLILSLQESGLHVGLQTTQDGLQVWISDRNFCRRVDEALAWLLPTGPVAIAKWFHAKAIKDFPDSAYAMHQRAQ